MSSYSFHWELKSEDEPGFAIVNFVAQVASEQMADLADLFPFRERWILSTRFETDWFAARLKSECGPGLPFVGKLNDEEWTALENAMLPFEPRNHKQLTDFLGPQWISASCFTYVGPHVNRHADWRDVQRHVVDWLNQQVVGNVVEINRRRVMRVLPHPPSFDTGTISNSCWIIECEETCTQGTAFALEDVGLVTCSHVVGPESVAFQAHAISKRFPLRLQAKHDVVDLAVAELPVQNATVLKKGSADSLILQDHIGIAGFPNYRRGDSLQFKPGLITGFRQVSGIRRPLTNAGIVRGNSGGPVLSRDNIVVGVAATGGDSVVDSERTEDQSIIPIDALRFID